MLVTVFALNSKCQPGLLRDTLLLLASSTGTPALLHTGDKGSISNDKKSGRPTTSFPGRPSRGSPLIRYCTLRTCMAFRQKK